MSAAVSSSLEISRLFSPANMNLNLHSAWREAVLADLIECIPGISRNDVLKQQLLRALVEREKLSCTAIGRGIAIPHTRSTIAGFAGRSLIVFGRHPDGVKYCADNPDPVFLFFLLLAPDINQHLQTLARLSRLLRDDELRQELLSVESPDAVIEVIANAENRVQQQ